MLSLMTEEQVAKQLSVSIASVRRWRLEKRGPLFVKVGTLVRYRPEDIESWLCALPTGGSERHSPSLQIQTGTDRKRDYRFSNRSGVIGDSDGRR
jgi:hypothetical protein